MVAYLYFKNSGKMEGKSEAGAGAILKVNCLRFASVFSYRYLRSDLTHTNKQTNTHTHKNIFFPSTVCTLSSKAHFPKLIMLADPFRLRKITTGPYIFARVNRVSEQHLSKIKNLFHRTGIR